MLKRELGFKKILHSILLFFSIFVLAGSVGSANGAVLKIHYVSDYNILNGTYLSGSVPSSVTSVDADYFIVRSVRTDTSVNAFNPSGYALLGSTSWVVGSVSNLTSNDGVNIVFSSYFSDTSTEDYVDNNTTDVDSGTDKGTHSNFSAQQYGPDSIYDTLMEENTGNYEIDLEVQWSNADYDETNEELAIYVDKGDNTHSLDATGGYMIIGDGTPDWGSTTGTISFWIKMDSFVQGRFWGQNGNMETRWSGTNLILDWGAADSMTSAYSFSADTWYFVAIVWDEINDNLFLYVGDENNAPTQDSNSLNGTWINTTPSPTENRFMNGLGGYQPVDGHGDDLRYWNTARNLTEIQSDYNIELAGSELNLRSYFKLNSNFDDIGPDNNDGSGSGSYSFSSDVTFDEPPTENIRVDAWNGTAWQNLFADLTSGWNNASVSSYLNSSTFTIRFKGSTEIGDTTQDTWDIDAVLLNTGTDQYTAEVEFVGSSDIYRWEQLNWTIDSAWTTDFVNVIIQLYNYTLGNYPTSGDGYIEYTSSSTPNTDDTKYQLVMSNPQDFRSDTGGWKIKVKGVKSTVTEFDFRADLIEFKPTYPSGYMVSTEFLFSSMTSNVSTQLNFTIVGQCNISSVNVVIQIWNYSSSTYATSGEGYLAYTSFGSNETKTLSINTNPQFYTSNGNAKMRITGVLAGQNQFQQEINQVIIKFSTQASSQPFDWFTTLLYVLPVVFVLPFLLVLKLKWRKTTKPHIEKKAVAFSKSFGMTHQQMVGKKMLLEIDPKSDYQNALFNFVSETRKNGETLFIFTSMNSTLHSAVSGTENVKFFLASLKTSRIQQINETETLLPAADLSVSLDAIVRYQKVEADKTVSMLFDNLSDIILTCGFEKTYRFMRFLLEAISLPKTTALFMFNPAAHDPTISSSIRGLFQTHLAYTKRGPNVGTLF